MCLKGIIYRYQSDCGVVGIVSEEALVSEVSTGTLEMHCF